MTPSQTRGHLVGGQMSAISAALDRGAVLSVNPPRKPEPPVLARPLREATPPARQIRILIIEDNRDAADSLHMLLEVLGHEVQVAYNGTAGLALADEWLPEVILSDIGLPGLDGYGVARELRRNPATAQIRLIAVTGYGSEADRRRAFEAGFDYHLTKPVDPEVLLALIGLPE
jgi:CheY-like chemotaxis protein